MEKLLEQAQSLVRGLAEEKEQSAKLIADLKTKEIRLDERKIELDSFQAELIQREADIKPIEDIAKTQREATQSKAEADVEWSKIRAEWDKLDKQKAKANEEIRIGKSEIAEKKALYDRGALENKKAKEVLDEKAKKFNEATGRV
jgi:chromosome segregation ATPase